MSEETTPKENIRHRLAEAEKELVNCIKKYVYWQLEHVIKDNKDDYLLDTFVGTLATHYGWNTQLESLFGCYKRKTLEEIFNPHRFAEFRLELILAITLGITERNKKKEEES